MIGFHGLKGCPGGQLVALLVALPLSGTVYAEPQDATCAADLEAWNCQLRNGRPFVPTVSLSALVSRPRLFDGVDVGGVAGVVSLEFEDVSLYFDEYSYRYALGANSIWLDFAPGVREKLPVSSGSPLEVVGTFRKGPCGHIGMSVGCLKVTHARRVVTRTQTGAEEERKTREAIRVFEERHGK